MLIITDTISSYSELFPYVPKTFVGYQFWYKKFITYQSTDNLQLYYRSDDEVKAMFRKQEEDRKYDNFLYARKYKIPWEIKVYFSNKIKMIEKKERAERRRIHKKLRKENYKRNYGWRHVK
jgi:hypothetical protein